MDVWENSTRESACLLKFIASRDLNNNRILKLNKREGYEKKKIKRIIENYNKSKKANNGKLKDESKIYFKLRLLKRLKK